MANTIEHASPVTLTPPVSNDRELGTSDNSSRDNFVLDNALADFNACVRSNAETSLGCAVLVAGSLSSFFWARARAAYLAARGNASGAAKVLEKAGEAANKGGRTREAISFFRDAYELYRQQGDQQGIRTAGEKYAEANEAFGRELTSVPDSDSRVARFLQDAVRVFTELGMNERAAVILLQDMESLYTKMNKPEMAAASLEAAAKNYAKAGKFAAAADIFAEAGQARENNHLPDVPDYSSMVRGYRSLEQAIEYARGQNDVRKVAKLETELAERILSHYLVEFAPHGYDIFVRHFAYHCRMAAEANFQAGEYVRAMDTLARLTAMIWKEGMEGHAGVEYLNATLRALEMTRSTLSRGQPGRRQKEKELGRYIMAFDEAYGRVPFQTKREGRYGRMVGDFLRAGELYVLAGKREKAEEMFRLASAPFAEERFQTDAERIKGDAEEALGLDGAEKVRKKWNGVVPPMSLVERRARITELAGALRDTEQAGGVERLARIYELMIENAKSALKDVQGADRAWLVAQLYNAKIGLHIVRLAEGRARSAGAILKKIKAMEPRVVALPEYEQGRSAVAFTVRTWLESAYQAFKKGNFERAFESFNEILQFAEREGLKAFETSTLEAVGDVTLLNGNKTIADGLYDRAMVSAATDEAREGVVLRRNEALMGNDAGVVRDIWGEMHPALWLFSRGLMELDGGVTDESLKDAVPPPEIAKVEGGIGRVKALETRREFLDAFRALRRARESVERAKER